MNIKLSFSVALLCGAISSSAFGMFVINGARQTRKVPSSATYFRLTEKKSESDIVHNALNNAYTKDRWNQVKRSCIAAIKKNKWVIDIPQFKETGPTLLCYALMYNDLNSIEFLLDRGANPNDELNGVHSTRPIFFAESLEALKLLEQYGAMIQVKNEGKGVTGGMNLLHASIGCDTSDDRLFDYCLEKGFDPKSLNSTHGNLWHSLVWCSVTYFPEEQLLVRANKLKELGIDPYHRNNKEQSAIDLVKKEIKVPKPLWRLSGTFESPLDIKVYNKMQKLLTLMTQNE